jgi:hypothetical protein
MFLGSRQGFCGLICGLGRRFVRGFAAYFVSKKNGWGERNRDQGLGNRDQKDRDLGT